MPQALSLSALERLVGHAAYSSTHFAPAAANRRQHCFDPLPVYLDL